MSLQLVSAPLLPLQQLDATMSAEAKTISAKAATMEAIAATMSAALGIRIGRTDMSIGRGYTGWWRPEPNCRSSNCYCTSRAECFGRWLSSGPA